MSQLRPAGGWSYLLVPEWNPTKVRRVLASLRRAGYSTHGDFGSGVRPLRGAREVKDELRRAAMLCDPDALPTLRPRSGRRPEPPRPGRLDRGLLELLLAMPNDWAPGWVGVSRGGPAVTDLAPTSWMTIAWCCVVQDEPDAPRIEVGVQMSPKGTRAHADPSEIVRVRAALRRLLAGHGYGHGSDRVWRTDQPDPVILIIDKQVSSLAEARAERRRIDRLVFR